MNAVPLRRFSAVAPDGTHRPVRRGNVYARDPAADRLSIGPDEDPLGLLLDLSAEWKGPFKILYVLVEPRTALEAGRYEFAWLGRDDAESLLARHARFLSCDGRHHLWFASPVEKRQVVWDRHEILHAHGPAAEFEAVLRARGFREGIPEIPSPHAHHVHAEFDGDEHAFLGEHPWIRYRLGTADSA